MKGLSGSLVLFSVMALFSVTDAHARACFIVGGQCTDGIPNFGQQTVYEECSKLGYTKKCESPKEPIGKPCTGNGVDKNGNTVYGTWYAACECPSQYQYTDADIASNQVLAGDECESKYEHYTCSSDFAYVSSSSDRTAVNGISYKTASVSTCPANLIVNSTNDLTHICTEENGINRYSECICDTSVYKFSANSTGFSTGVFSLGTDCCTGPDGIKRCKTATCNGGQNGTTYFYKDSCNLDDGFKPVSGNTLTLSGDSSGSVTCSACKEATCADYNAVPEDDIPSAFERMDVDTGNSGLECFNIAGCKEGYQVENNGTSPIIGVDTWGERRCYKKGCSDYSEGGIVLQDGACLAGYTSTTYTKKLGNVSRTCYRCYDACGSSGKYASNDACVADGNTDGCKQVGGCYQPYACEDVTYYRNSGGNHNINLYSTPWDAIDAQSNSSSYFNSITTSLGNGSYYFGDGYKGVNLSTNNKLTINGATCYKNNNGCKMERVYKRSTNGENIEYFASATEILGSELYGICLDNNTVLVKYDGGISESVYYSTSLEHLGGPQAEFPDVYYMNIINANLSTIDSVLGWNLQNIQGKDDILWRENDNHKCFWTKANYDNYDLIPYTFDTSDSINSDLSIRSNKKIDGEYIYWSLYRSNAQVDGSVPNLCRNGILVPDLRQNTPYYGFMLNSNRLSYVGQCGYPTCRYLTIRKFSN